MVEILVPFLSHLFLFRKGLDKKVDLKVEKTGRKGKYRLYVPLLHSFRVGNALAIADVYGQGSLCQFGGFSLPLYCLPPF